MDITEIRRQRLRKLIDDKFGGVVLRLANTLEMKPPQLHRWLSGRQGMHEESARAVEVHVGIEAGWLDRTEDAEADAHTSHHVEIREQAAFDYTTRALIEDGARTLAARAAELARLWLAMPAEARDSIEAQVRSQSPAAPHALAAHRATLSAEPPQNNAPALKTRATP